MMPAMPKWRVFALSRLYHCFEGDGVIIVPLYFVQDCGLPPASWDFKFCHLIYSFCFTVSIGLEKLDHWGSGQLNKCSWNYNDYCLFILLL